MKEDCKRSQEKHPFPLQLSTCTCLFYRLHILLTKKKHNNMAAKLIWGENMANALSKVLCCVEEHFVSLLPMAVRCYSLVHGSEVKDPLWNIFEWTNDEWSNDERDSFWNGRIESFPHVRYSTPFNGGRTTDKSRAPPPSLFVFPDAEQGLVRFQPPSIQTECTSGSMSMSVFTEVQRSDSLPLDFLIFLNVIHLCRRAFSSVV